MRRPTTPVRAIEVLLVAPATGLKRQEPLPLGAGNGDTGAARTLIHVDVDRGRPDRRHRAIGVDSIEPVVALTSSTVHDIAVGHGEVVILPHDSRAVLHRR